MRHWNGHAWTADTAPPPPPLAVSVTTATAFDASIEAGSYQSDTPSHRDRTERRGERN